jgi:ligand-binding sensor domain-containing protein
VRCAFRRFEHCEGERGAIWIGTASGLALIRNGKFEPVSSANALPDENIFSLARAPDLSLWIGAETGVAHYAGGRFSFLPINDPDKTRSTVRAIYADEQNNVWVGTNGAGLLRINGGPVSVYSTRNGLAGDAVRTIYRDRAGTLWIGTRGGLSRYLDGRFESYTTSQGLTSDSVRSLLEDNNGALWIGMGGGGLLRLHEGSVQTLVATGDHTSNTVFPVLEDSHGAVWAGTQGAGVNRWANGKLTTITTSDGLSDNFISSLAEDHAHNLWIGTRAGLNRVRNKQIEKFHAGQNGIARDLPSDVIDALYADREGRVWIGTRAGLAMFDGRKFHAYATKNTFGRQPVRAFYEDRRAVLWVGTPAGLALFRDGQLIAPASANAAARHGVYGITGDADDAVWLGTDAGVIRYKAGHFSVLESRSDPFTDSVWDILLDDSGNAWMTSNRGIFRVALHDLNLLAEGKITRLDSRQFGTADGMKSKECNGGFQPAGWKTASGNLLFPTIKGVAVINPRNLKLMNTAPPPVVIESIIVNRVPFAPEQEIRLPPGQAQLEFHFSSPNLNSAPLTHFAYKLEDFDKDWIDARFRREAFYNNLAPGTYKFRVIAANSEGVWNQKGAAKTITLLPHFYQTWLFAGFSVILVAGLCLAAYRARMRSIRLNQDKLTKLVEERTRALEHRSLALQESEKRFRTLAENIHEVFWIFDPQGRKLIPGTQAFRAWTLSGCTS